MSDTARGSEELHLAAPASTRAGFEAGERAFEAPATLDHQLSAGTTGATDAAVSAAPIDASPLGENASPAPPARYRSGGRTPRPTRQWSGSPFDLGPLEEVTAVFAWRRATCSSSPLAVSFSSA